MSELEGDHLSAEAAHRDENQHARQKIKPKTTNMMGMFRSDGTERRRASSGDGCRPLADRRVRRNVIGWISDVSMIVWFHCALYSRGVQPSSTTVLRV